jgi:serine/threonine protein kinase
MSSNIVVKGYKTYRQIDHTGFRTVYSALHLKQGEEVYITIIGVRPGRDLNLLLKRAELSQKLDHPFLVTAIDYGQLPEDRFYYTHSATPSYPVKSALEGINDPDDYYYAVVSYMIEALEALAYVHNAQLTHRDLMVGQIRVSKQNQLLLEGFINARPKQESRNVAEIVHLPYMAPEQLMGAASDKKTDIYSMGVILFELICGALPYSSNFAKIQDARKGGVPLPSKLQEGIPSELENIIMKSISPRKTRYVRVGELIDDLEEFYDKRSLRLKLKDFSFSFKKLFAAKD